MSNDNDNTSWFPVDDPAVPGPPPDNLIPFPTRKVNASGLSPEEIKALVQGWGAPPSLKR